MFPFRPFSPLLLRQQQKCSTCSPSGTHRPQEPADDGQITMDNICNPDPNVAPMRMVCSSPRVFFTASILWGTLGPKRIWGVGGQYNITLVGFAFGFILCLATYFLRRQLPNTSWLRKIHTLVFLQGFALWDIFGLVFVWPAVPVALVSWLYVRTRWLGFWSKVRNRRNPCRPGGIFAVLPREDLVTVANGPERLPSTTTYSTPASHAEPPSLLS